MMTSDIDEIEQLYLAGRLILCIGPDLPREAGLATPLDLARQLAGHLREVDPHGDFTELDEQLDAGHDDRALGILRHRLGAEEFIRRARSTLEGSIDEIPEMARLIAGVANGLRAVYTTNLDRLIERAFGGRWWAAAEGHADLARRNRVIVKLFGTAGRPETWVLTARDHERAYGGHDERREAFEAIYRSHAILFLGFDEGPALLRRLLAAVGSALAGDEPPTHFLATDLASHGHESRREFEERGLRMVSITTVLELLRDLAIADSERSLDQPAPQLSAELPSPYPGLEPYTRALADFFYGRDEELARALGMLSGSKRWLSVQGPSGVGKSSFLRAGLVRAFEQGQVSREVEQWKMLIMRPGKRPLLDLATELCRLFDVSGIDTWARSFRDEHGLSGFLREHVTWGMGLVIMIDQLEELLTFSEIEQRQYFADALADALADDGVPMVLVTTLRSDFVSEFTSQEHGLARMFDTGAEHQILRGMSEAELREVIVQPARSLGVGFEHRLPERILQDTVRMSPGDGMSEAALPLVAHVLRGLWDEGGERGRLTLEAYERLGGISGAVTRSADRVLEGLSKSEQERAREVLLMLVNVDVESRDTRRARTREELLEKAGAGEEGRRLLMHLSGQAAGEAVVRLISLNEGEHARVDLVHEALTHEWTTMRSWLAERRKELVARSDLARNVRRWSEQGRPWRGLPGGAELRWMLKVEAENDEQRKYQRALRWVRGLRLGAAVGGLALVVGAAIAFATLWVRSDELYEQSQQLYVQSQERMERAAELGSAVATTIDRKLQEIPGTVDMRRELMGMTRELLEWLAEVDPNNPSLLRARMLEHRASGDLAMTHGQSETALGEYAAALDHARALTDVDPNSSTYRRDVGVSLVRLARVEAKSSYQRDRARAHFEESLQIQRKARSDAEATDPESHTDLTKSLIEFGDLERESGRLDQARMRYDEAMQVLTELDPDSVVFRQNTSLVLLKLAFVERVAGQLDVALELSQRSLQIRRELASTDPDNPSHQQSVGEALSGLGLVAMAMDDLEQARACFEERLQIMNKLLAADSTNVVYKRDKSAAFMTLAEVAYAGSRMDEARTFVAKSLLLRHELATGDPDNLAYRQDIVQARSRLGDVEVASGRADEAYKICEETLQLSRDLVEAAPDNMEYRRSMSVALLKLADLDRVAGRKEQAREALVESLGIFRDLAELDSTNVDRKRDMTVALGKLGGLDITLKNWEGARSAFEENVRLRREWVAKNPRNTEYQRDLTVSLIYLGDVELASKHLDRARALYDEALGLRRDLAVRAPTNASHRWDIAEALAKLGELELASGRRDAARSYFDESRSMSEELVKLDPTNADYLIDLVTTHISLAEVVDESLRRKHLSQADLILDNMAKQGQLDGFESRLQLREEVDQLLRR